MKKIFYDYRLAEKFTISFLCTFRETCSMKRIIVPTDFSETSKNAARYAVQIAGALPQASVILYHVSTKMALGSDSSPLTEDSNDRSVVFHAALENWKTEFGELSPANIELVAEEGNSLTDSLASYLSEHETDLVVMGITGATRSEQIFMGSNALNVVNLGVCPVFIVPPDAVYKPIRKVLFACDFKDVSASVPLVPIKSILELFRPTVLVVNAGKDADVEASEEYKTERAVLENMLKDYSPEFYFIRMEDFEDAISSFAAERDVDLILIVPKKKSFLQGLFKSSHTKKLAYHSHVPILAVHE